MGNRGWLKSPSPYLSDSPSPQSICVNIQIEMYIRACFQSVCVLKTSPGDHFRCKFEFTAMELIAIRIRTALYSKWMIRQSPLPKCTWKPRGIAPDTPWKISMKPKSPQVRRKIIFQCNMFGFYVDFPGWTDQLAMMKANSCPPFWAFSSTAWGEWRVKQFTPRANMNEVHSSHSWGWTEFPDLCGSTSDSRFWLR